MRYAYFIHYLASLIGSKSFFAGFLIFWLVFCWKAVVESEKFFISYSLKSIFDESPSFLRWLFDIVCSLNTFNSSLLRLHVTNELKLEFFRSYIVSLLVALSPYDSKAFITLMKFLRAVRYLLVSFFMNLRLVLYLISLEYIIFAKSFFKKLILTPL